jgi:hypothetical protein
MHLIDALMYCVTHRLTVSEVQLSRDQYNLLTEIESEVLAGEKLCVVQNVSHPVLLDRDFYHERLLPLFAKWALVWILIQRSVKESIEKLLGQSVPQQEIMDAMVKFISTPSFSDKKTASVIEQFYPEAIQLLNLTRDWITMFLAHCFAKINRINYGLLQPDDIKKLEQESRDPMEIPKTRRLLAVPFIGKDFPSHASEFAHPDILIGLSIFAYRYEGLRQSDIKRLVGVLKATLAAEPGIISDRPTFIRFQDWISTSKQIFTQVKAASDNLRNSTEIPMRGSAEIKKLDPETSDKEIDVLPLDLFQPEDDEQLKCLGKLISRLPEAVHYYLEHIIFPEVLVHQKTKLQTSGYDLGSDMLFGVRLGFSGTPSDILPRSLQPCQYEPLSDSRMIHVLTNASIITSEIVEFSSVRQFLRYIAKGKFNALIDCGAIVTGFTNEEVARILLKEGLEGTSNFSKKKFFAFSVFFFRRIY